METIIKLSPNELNAGLLDKIRNFIGDKQNINISISFKEMEEDYATVLNRSIQQVEGNDIISFSMEDFMKYKPIAGNS